MQQSRTGSPFVARSLPISRLSAIKTSARQSRSTHQRSSLGVSGPIATGPGSFPLVSKRNPDQATSFVRSLTSSLRAQSRERDTSASVCSQPCRTEQLDRDHLDKARGQVLVRVDRGKVAMGRGYRVDLWDCM